MSQDFGQKETGKEKKTYMCILWPPQQTQQHYHVMRKNQIKDFITAT